MARTCYVTNTRCGRSQDSFIPGYLVNICPDLPLQFQHLRHTLLDILGIFNAISEAIRAADQLCLSCSSDFSSESSCSFKLQQFRLDILKSFGDLSRLHIKQNHLISNIISIILSGIICNLIAHTGEYHGPALANQAGADDSNFFIF